MISPGSWAKSKGLLVSKWCFCFQPCCFLCTDLVLVWLFNELMQLSKLQENEFSKKYTSPGKEKNWTVWEWRWQWGGEEQTSEFCCTFGVFWGMSCSYLMLNLPLHLLGGASLKRAQDEHAWAGRLAGEVKEGHPAAPAPGAERGLNGTAAAQQDVGMGRRVVQEEPRRKGDTCRVTTEGYCDKHWKNAWIQGNSPILLI